MNRSLLAGPILVAVAIATPAQAARCFSMYDAKNRLVLQSVDAPIDLSRPIADQMRARYPSRYLVISDSGSCPDFGAVAVGSATSAAALLPSRSDGMGGTAASTSTSSSSSSALSSRPR